MDDNTSDTYASIVSESFDSLKEYRRNNRHDLSWSCVFVLPDWMAVWWDKFGDKMAPFIFTVLNGADVTGIAPLKLEDNVASFIGSADICDYLDFVVSPKNADFFFDAMLDHIRANNIRKLDLRCLRPDSITQKKLIPIAEKRGYDVACEPDGVSLETELPGSWDDYLMQLKSKQRHEVRRKFRRLYEAGDVKFEVYDEPESLFSQLGLFLKLFRESRADKTAFMTPKMESFFNDMISAMAACGVLKLGVMSLNGKPVAAVLYFDYGNSIYLYNNGYDTAFGSLSIGVLSKAILIQHGINERKNKFDFLKGTETYKYRLGGKEVPLNRLQIILS